MVDSLAEFFQTESYLIKRLQITTNHSSLDGQVITINGLEKTITEVLVQVILSNNSSFTYLIKPIHPSLQLNLSKQQPPPVWQNIQLGIYHIWTGFVHLLFVLGILSLVKKDRAWYGQFPLLLLLSITLALATLHIVNVSYPLSATC